MTSAWSGILIIYCIFESPASGPQIPDLMGFRKV